MQAATRHSGQKILDKPRRTEGRVGIHIYDIVDMRDWPDRKESVTKIRSGAKKPYNSETGVQDVRCRCRNAGSVGISQYSDTNPINPDRISGRVGITRSI